MSIFIIIFVIGYAAIALEHPLRINKAASALLTGVLIWTFYITSDGASPEHVNEQLIHHLSEIAQIVFFLWGAMTIVELIDAHEGFALITDRIAFRSKWKLLWVMLLIAFFLSALLDNMTTAIVMVSIIRKILANPKDRLVFIGMVVIAANAGGAWSPIGDVTTTMLWIGGQITASGIVSSLLIPSLVALVVPTMILSFRMKGQVQYPEGFGKRKHVYVSDAERRAVFFLGIGALIFVPIFKNYTHLPPFLGMMFSLGMMWLATEVIHKGKNDELKKKTTVAGMLGKIDTPSLLFFSGILLAVGGLQSIGLLAQGADIANTYVPSKPLFLTYIGGVSAVLDNIPLVNAVQNMFSLQEYPADHSFWEYLAYSAGTGGSLLVIGSAAGVAAMGIEKELSFGWYVKNITPYALISFLSGAGIYLLMHPF